MKVLLVRVYEGPLLTRGRSNTSHDCQIEETIEETMKMEFIQNGNWTPFLEPGRFFTMWARIDLCSPTKIAQSTDITHILDTAVE